MVSKKGKEKRGVRRSSRVPIIDLVSCSLYSTENETPSTPSQMLSPPLPLFLDAYFIHRINREEKKIVSDMTSPSP